jgi:GH25 family lysozyme M1 (1,4-beta-N-acetylmuramidase)
MIQDRRADDCSPVLFIKRTVKGYLMSTRGIDVSSYQGKPDWTEVRKSGVEFAIMRILNSKGKDASFEYNYSRCGKAGIRRGVYRFSYALTAEQTKKEAEEVLTALAGRKLEMGVWLDLEWNRQRAVGKEKIRKLADSWMKIIREGGYECNIYCNMDWYRNLCGGLDAKYWLARYPSDDNGSMKEALRPNIGEVGWQYSSHGRISGICGNVDMDLWYDNLDTEKTDGSVQTVFWDSSAVAALQEALNADGIRDNEGDHLKVDGIKGGRTDSAIEKILLKAGCFDPAKGRYGTGSIGQVVKWLQMRLNTMIGDRITELLGAGLDPDGKFGSDTWMAVGLFQESCRLKTDYIVGAKTVTELLKI